MHWVTVHGLSESAQKIYYTDTSNNSTVENQPYSEFLSEWDWSIGDGLANETIWGKGVPPKTMVWVDKNPPAIAIQPNPTVRSQPGFYSRVGMNPPGIVYLWPSPWDGGKTDVWCDVPNHEMYVRNLNHIGSAIEVNSLETVKGTAKYWSQPCTDHVFQQSGVQR